MKISTKGRYALRVMIDLAQHYNEGNISLKDIAERQGLSMKYLEMIASILNRAGFLNSQRGKTGGYQLKYTPEEYSVGTILKEAEGSLAPVSCLDHAENECEHAGDCITLPLWEELDRITYDYLDSVSLADLLCGDVKRES
jgi:Rrf2 family protein